MITERFPGTTAVFLSRLIKEVFPNSSSKQRGREKVTYIVRSFLACRPLPHSLVHRLLCQPLPFPLASRVLISALLLELQTERDKEQLLRWKLVFSRRGLRQCHRLRVQQITSTNSVPRLMVLCRHRTHYCMVLTVEHFHDFSMASVIAELQATCPEVYSLVQQLGSTQRYEKDGVLPDEVLKGVMAICTLHGLQG